MPLLSDLSWPRLTRSATEPGRSYLDFLTTNTLTAMTTNAVAIHKPIAKSNPSRCRIEKTKGVTELIIPCNFPIESLRFVMVILFSVFATSPLGEVWSSPAEPTEPSMALSGNLSLDFSRRTRPNSGLSFSRVKGSDGLSLSPKSRAGRIATGIGEKKWKPLH
ncbi:hypothetical protein C1H46_034991 [Malus baccata]|uniref:Uncharacterized protein n=1 Tax=Malus baccata TaxID=106549 RepID=A0A540KZP3_MALBA|nr:hypothetical protein C1H46_034991 [Malus baccata]